MDTNWLLKWMKLCTSTGIDPTNTKDVHSILKEGLILKWN